jgi:hypothetical protein
MRSMVSALGFLALVGCMTPPPYGGLHKVVYEKNAAGDCMLTLEGGQEFSGLSSELNPCGDKFTLGINDLRAFEGQRQNQGLYDSYVAADAAARQARMDAFMTLGMTAGRPAMCAAAATASFALGALCPRPDVPTGGGTGVGGEGNAGVIVVPDTDPGAVVPDDDLVDDSDVLAEERARARRRQAPKPVPQKQSSEFLPPTHSTRFRQAIINASRREAGQLRYLQAREL